MTPSREQDASFIAEGTLVNIETKTVTLTSSVSGLSEGSADASGEVTGRPSGRAVTQLRLGLGQVLEQAQAAPRRSGRRMGRRRPPLGRTVRCGAGSRARERGPDATWAFVRVDHLDAGTAAVLDRWQRTCARAGATLITVSTLEHLITDGTTDWARS